MTGDGRSMTARSARARLGVGPGADERALRAAFREAAKRNHPDRPGGDPAAFREIMEAYRVLREDSAAPAPFAQSRPRPRGSGRSSRSRPRCPCSAGRRWPRPPTDAG
jgi:curved DNA-binding protein